MASETCAVVAVGVAAYGRRHGGGSSWAGSLSVGGRTAAVRLVIPKQTSSRSFRNFELLNVWIQTTYGGQGIANNWL